MTLWFRALCRFALFASREWQYVLFWSFEHCILCWLCWWARCWMLQDMDHMEASCVIYVKVGMSNWLEQSTICFLTITTLGIAMRNVHHYMMFGIFFLWDPVNCLRYTTPDVVSVAECAAYISQSRHLRGRSHSFIPVNKHPTSDWPNANSRTVGSVCNVLWYAAGFIMCGTCMLAVTHSIVTWG